MAADISTTLASWSTTAGSNAPADSTLIGGNLDDNLRQIQATVRAVWSQDTISSATTTDIGAKDAGSLTVTGTTTITGFGTVSAGIRKWLTFGNTLTLTHSGSSLILPTAANITTAAGDVGCFESQGSGNWRCLSYLRYNGSTVGAFTVSDGTVSAPGMRFTSDPDTGVYRIGANSLGIATSGVQRALFSATDIALASAGTASVSAAGNMSFSTSSSGNVTIDSAGGLTVSSATAASISTDAGASPNELTIEAGAASGANPGARVRLIAGNSASGTGGHINLLAGTGATESASGQTQIMGGSGGAGYALRIPAASGHLLVDDNELPTVTSGAGTSPSINGSDTAFKVTLGTTPTTTVRVTFKYAFANAPIVVAQYQTSNIAVRCVPTTTYVDLTFASSPASGGIVHVMCIGYDS